MLVSLLCWYPSYSCLQDMLYHQYKIECPVKCIQGTLYVRISAFIYNCTDDYQALASAVLTLAAREKHPPI